MKPEDWRESLLKIKTDCFEGNDDLMIFKREEMIEEEVLRCREGKKFEQKYLRKEYLKENTHYWTC